MSNPTSTMTSLIPQKYSVVTIVQEKDKATKLYTAGLVSLKLFEYVLNVLAKF